VTHEVKDSPVVAGPGIFWGRERIGYAFDLKPSAVSELVSTPGFPEPVRVGHPRWDSLEVVKWYKSHRRRK